MKKSVKTNKKLLSVSRVYDGKFIKNYVAEYDVGGKIKKYEIVSRKDVLDIESGKHVPDAVRIVPYYYEKGELKVVLIREFRYPLNEYIYAVPAGLIDGGEQPIKSAIRELKEEIGAEVKNIREVEKFSYASPGFSDESLICFEAEVELNSKQSLDSFEDIEVVIVNLDKLEKMLDKEDFGLQSRLQLRAFLYKQKYEQLKKNCKNKN